MTIGDVLKKLRLDRGLTQGQLAVKSGVARSTISMIEMGQRASPNCDTLMDLALALETTPNDVLVLAGLMPRDDIEERDRRLEELERLLRHMDEDSQRLVVDLARKLTQ